MNFVRTKGMATLALLLTLPVAACDNSMDPEFGSVSIQLTDAPGDNVVKAYVTITDIYFQQRPGDVDPVDSRAYVMEAGASSHELVSLANDVAELVGSATVPAGRYNQLRLVIPQACIITDTGEVFASPGYVGNAECLNPDGDLHLPSYEDSGIKVLLNGVEVGGDQENLLLDFDVSQSFGRQAGNSGTWVMSPVIRGARLRMAAAIDVTLEAGEVTLPGDYSLGDFQAMLEPSGGGDANGLPFTDEDGDGVYEASFRYLVPDNGPWDVYLIGPQDLDFTVSPDSPRPMVDPGEGETATVDWVLQSATNGTGGGDIICGFWVCGGA